MPSAPTRPRSRVAKVAVSLPAGLLAEVERFRRRSGESRSALVRRALERLIDTTAEADAVREYVESYRASPETPEERSLSKPSAEELGALAREHPWK